MAKEIIFTDEAPAPIGAYSQAVRVGHTVYLAGQIGLDSKTMELVSDQVESQAQRVFENIRAVCIAAGGNLMDVVKLNVYLISLADMSLVNGMMVDYFISPYPARAAVGVAQLPKNALIEIEAIAIIE